MIEFIGLEDNLLYVTKYKEIIDKVMMNYDVEYHYTIYDKFSSKIKNLLTKEVFAIYLISYKDKNHSLEMIEYIRENLDDWHSLIIVLYESEEDIGELSKKSLFLIDTISKQENIERRLRRSIQICLKNYDERPNTLKFCYKKIFYNIEYWKILYIEREQDNKRCKIKTIEKEYYIPGCLNKLSEKLDKRFLKCNRSYIINLEQIESYDSKNNKIIFKNKEEFEAISRDKKKEITNYFRGIV